MYISSTSSVYHEINFSLSPRKILEESGTRAVLFQDPIFQRIQKYALRCALFNIYMEKYLRGKYPRHNCSTPSRFLARSEIACERLSRHIENRVRSAARIVQGKPGYAENLRRGFT